MKRVGTRVAGVAALVLLLAACFVPPPLTRPLVLTPPADAKADIAKLLGDPPPQADTPLARARQVAQRLTRMADGCDVLTIADVVWVDPNESTASAAIELRGVCDDSTLGTWYQLTFSPDAQLGWVVATATKQAICARGVASGLCV